MVQNMLKKYSAHAALVICAGSLLGLFWAFSAQAAAPGSGDIQYVDPDTHFHPKGKPPSEHTLKVIRDARKTMPFDDRRDYEEAEKGFVAPLNSKIIKADAGHVAWDIERYEFFAMGRDFDSIHPSLQR